MQHQKKRTHYARIVLSRLEDRTLPSTLLAAESALELPDFLVEPEAQRVGSVQRRIQPIDDAPVVSLASVETERLTAPVPLTLGVSVHASSYEPGEVLLSPAIHHPRPVVERVSVGGRNLIRTTGADRAVKPIIRRFDAGSRLGQSTSRSMIHQDEGGERSAVWSTYDSPGSSRADKVNAVAVGVGPGLGRTIAVGKQGRIGTIKQYSSSGALLITQTLLPAPGNRMEIMSVAVDPMGGRPTGDIYVVARETTSSGTVVKTSVECFPIGGGGSSASLVYPPGMTKSLDDITVNSQGGRAGPEISVVGTADIGAGYDVVQISHMTTSLTGVVDVFADFGTAAQGLSIATNSLDTRFIGGRVVSSGIRVPLKFDLLADDLTNTWAFSSTLGSPSDKASNGYYGMTVVGSRLFLAGSVTDFVFNPAISPDPEDYDNVVIQDADVFTGVPDGYFAGWGIPGGNYSASGNTRDAFGRQLTAGSADDIASPFDPQTLSFADTSEFDSTGTLTNRRVTGDCDGVLNKDSDGLDIALHADGDVAVGGETNAGKVSFEAGLCPIGNPPQLLNGADSTYGFSGSPSSGPPSDGYVFRDEVPVGG